MTNAWRLAPFTWFVLVVCGVIELIALGADLGWIGTVRLRQTAFEFAGFWPGLLRDWTPNYPGQAILMFLTYSFLHVGPSHFVSNMVSLIYLDVIGTRHFGIRRYAIAYLFSVLGGAVGYGLLSKGLVPMVGASGAIFGMAGAVLAWEYLDRKRFRENLWPVLVLVGILVAMNIVLWYAMKGHLAWQTHLGGFIAGVLVGALCYQAPSDVR